MKDLKVRFTVLNFPSRNKFRKWLDLGQECDLDNCGRLKPYGMGAIIYYEDRVPYKEEIPAQVEIKDEYVALPLFSFLYRKKLAVKVLKEASFENKFKVVIDPVAEGYSILHPSDRFNPNYGKLTALQDLLNNYEMSMNVEEVVYVKNLIEEYSDKIKTDYSIVVFKASVKDVSEGYNYKEQFDTIEDLLEWMFHEEPENYIVYQSLPGGKKKIDIVKDDGTGIYTVAQLS